MKYGVMTYEDTSMGTNIGDYIQSIAARQYLPRVDSYVNREYLDKVSDGPIKLIMNGWFTHHPENWPPSDDIIPLFVAFHINATHAAKMLTSSTWKYLKMHEPVGCRDQYTFDVLSRGGVNAYLSGCLTLTLDSYKIPDNERNDKIYIVDPIFNLMSVRDGFTTLRMAASYIRRGLFLDSYKRHLLINKIIHPSIRQRAEWRHHMLKPNNLNENARFGIADSLLKEYARARCVITSRIHCALPCLALGTPVIFINSFEDESNLSRLNGLTDLFHVINLNIKTGSYSSNFSLENNQITLNTIIPNKENYQKFANPLKERCRKFVEEY